MSKPVCAHVLVLLALGLAVAGLGAFGFAFAEYASPARVSARDVEPVAVTGGDTESLIGVPVDELFVYAYAEGAWKQIPAQVDEVTLSGVYAAEEDGLLDANDEIVFMAKDLGEQPQADSPITASLPISPVLYEIDVTDPLDMMQKGWAVLVHSSVLTPTNDGDYVTFNQGFHRLITARYTLGLAVMHSGADYLTLNGSPAEILDRTKVRIFCHIPFTCPFTEDSLSPVPDNLIKDGPVRVILRGGRIMAYGDMVRWTTAYSIPPLLQGSVRVSTDFNEAASGATYYNATLPEGVTVDGKQDAVPIAPLSYWWQLSTATGTLIQVADTTSIGGVQSNYYVDDLAWDATDTGDRHHYGDSGIAIENSRSAFTYTFAFYMLPGTQPNVGALYETAFWQPLSAKTTRRGPPSPEKTYLPVISASGHR